MLTQHVLLVFAAAVCTFRAKLLLLLLNLLGNLSKRFKQLRRADRLEQIRVRVQRNRLCAYSNSSCPLRNTIRSHGMVRRTTFASSRPSINGMRMSVMSTSGFISISIGSAISPSGAHLQTKRFLLLFNAVADAIPDDLLIIRNKSRIIAFSPPVRPVR